MVEPPSVEDTISILRGLKERFELQHGVKIQDNALVSAAVLSNRYISDRFLPDKAIDLVDEACALIRTEIDPAGRVGRITRRIMQLEIEQARWRKRRTAPARSGRGAAAGLAELKAKADGMRAQWKPKSAAIAKGRALREEVRRCARASRQPSARPILEKAVSSSTAA